jgi:CubicO group peptidase (beta-lactamase class C family)
MSVLRFGTPEEAGMRPERLALLERRAAEWVAGGDPPTLVLLAARRGVVCLHRAWGQQRPAGRALVADDVFPVASFTKVITATLTMMLVEDGLLGLNRPAYHYLPELDGEGTAAIQVHHLLTHTSGLHGEDVDAHTLASLRKGVTPPAAESSQHPLLGFLLAARWSVPLRYTPGTVMSYSTHNYMLVGEIVRRVSGRSLEDFARERLFGPLGMNDSFYVVPDTLRDRVIRRPDHAPQPVPVSKYYQGLDSVQAQTTPYPDGGVFSTARDLAVLAQTFLQGGEYGGRRIVTQATAAAMTRNQIPGVPADFFGRQYREGSWGFGWQIHSAEKWQHWFGELLVPDRSFMHGGFGGTLVWVDPRNEIVGVILMVVMNVTKDWEHICNMDLINNLVTSAVAD